jgi:hypothetical protein
MRDLMFESHSFDWWGAMTECVVSGWLNETYRFALPIEVTVIEEDDEWCIVADAILEVGGGGIPKEEAVTDWVANVLEFYGPRRFDRRTAKIREYVVRDPVPAVDAYLVLAWERKDWWKRELARQKESQ